MDDVTCPKGGRTWSSCTFKTDEDCEHSEDVHITCIATEWKSIQRDQKITFDKLTSTIEFKTYSTKGSANRITLYFYDSEDNIVGSFLFKFFDLTFQIGLCSNSWVTLQKASEVLSDDSEKLWSVTRTINGIQISVDGEMVLDVIFSEALCTRDVNWESRYDKLTRKFAFIEYETDSVYRITDRKQEDQFNTPFALVDEGGNRVKDGEQGLLLYKRGTVCDDKFTDDAANSICRDMGFGTADKWSSGLKHDIQNSYTIKMDDVTCPKGGRTWSSCTFKTDEDCEHSEDVHITCIATEWKSIQRDQKITFDKLTSTIEFKTYSTKGSANNIALYFYGQ